MNNHTTYKKYPYAGYSQNLMEYFYIIGYSSDKISSYGTKNNQHLPEPEILSIVNNSSQIKVVDSEIILRQIFPSTPGVIDINEQKARPKKSTVIFSLNPDDYNQPIIKIPSCCSALIFYEQNNKLNPKFFIPKAFCIVSQYPYFSFFNDINKRILECFEKKLDIPIEIIIFNMLNFIPSPINFDLELNIFPMNEKNNKIFNKAFSVSSGSFRNNNSNKGNLKLKANVNTHINSTTHNTNNNFNINTGKDSRTFSNTSHNSNSSSNSPMYHNFTYKLRQLSGYPQMDMDIIKLFNILPIESIIEIFIMLLLEIDVIFFSKNLEILNSVMYIFSKLTFPCDDSDYQWSIVTVSKGEFSLDNRFSGRTGTLMIGVNCTYEATIETYKVRENNIVVDLDNKKVEFITTSQEEFDTMSDFRKFLKVSILPAASYSYLFINQNTPGANFFFPNFLNKLYTDLLYYVHKNRALLPSPYNLFSLNSCSNVANDRQTLANNNIILSNLNFNNANEAYGALFDFFDYSDVDKIYKSNKEIQEIFYNFMIQLLSVFYNFFKLKSISEKNIDISEEMNSFFIKCSDENNDKEYFEQKYNTFNEHEKYFYKNFISSKRYDKFFLGFLVKSDVNKMHKMSYQFSEEYIYILKSQGVQLNSDVLKEENVLRTLSLIDQFYGHHNQISTIIQKSELYKDFNIYNEEFTCFSQLKHLLKFTPFISDAGKTYSETEKITLTLNFEDFYKIYYDSLIKDIFKFDNINFMESIVNLTIYENKKLITHKYCEIENNFLFNYFYYLNNYCETIPRDEIFIYDKICKINSVPIIKSTDISDFIENEFMKFSNLNIDNVLIYGLINLFMIVVAENFSSEFYSSLKELVNIIKSKNIYIRKYLELILNTFIDPKFTEEKDLEGYAEQGGENNKNLNNNRIDNQGQFEDESKRINSIRIPRKSFYGKRTSSYYVMVNFIREQDILPTDNFLNILNIINNMENKGACNLDYLDQEDSDKTYKFTVSMQYNRCKCGFKNKDYFIQETLNYKEDENVYLNCKVCNKIDNKTKFLILITGDGVKLQYNVEIFSIRKIFKTSQDLFRHYLKSFDLTKIDLILLQTLILNLMFYCDNECFKIVKNFLFRSFNLVYTKIVSSLKKF